MKRTTPYGALLRERRVKAGLSLRDVAEHIGVSHVFLAEVERGVTATLKPEREAKLLEVLPNVTGRELAKAREASKPIKITLANTPAKYVDLTIALARRYEKENLSDTQQNRILEILSEDRDEGRDDE